MTDELPERLSVGYVRRAHGLRGEVVVRLTTNRDERVAVGAELVADDQTLVVATSRPNDGDFLLRFDGVNDRNAADLLKGTELFAAPIDDPDELWVHELVGCRVIDVSGVDRGVVQELLANPASDLLALDSEALVPVRFITDVADRVITVDVPEGLFEVYEA